ncbi:sodium-dependent lysophosphatidylcholine symporter 1-like [Branchiostoma floridae]|uniref:Sodium-dependent lysophosphatidylcholine symporter 1-like n=1 Tax=Branchiostoma floridae TaxID=7739 RepID=A0A9J7L945_BRAFL|nr:sodium-dependent lysophosphatidylcholine symporter 1-like [Branchiostoma floridae]XP_035677640.1 sodium-dependent lysophosphatidylcholine symporter 1-like [Branchiostoma floridae]XP_035677641.1 sodium-dependent lysophosphatidylcholine symporter 1-like [Branchiostoma floridae]
MTDLSSIRKPLSVVAKLCYGIGGAGIEITWAVLGAYTSTFLVQVAQMPPLFATSIIFGSRAVDVFCNFILGPLIDRTNTRWGKAKPWIMVSQLIIAVMNALIWYVPDVGTDGKLAWYILLYTVMKIAMSGFSISHRTYLMFLSDDNSDRDSAVLYRSLVMVGGTVGGMALHGQILASYRRSDFDACDNNATYGANNTNSSMDDASLAMTKNGYMISAAAVCLLVLIGLIATAFGTTERKDISRISGGERAGQFQLRTLKTVLTFRPYVFYLVTYFCVQTSASIGHGAVALYAQYSLDLEDQIENVILAVMTSSALAIPLIAFIVSKFGKKTTYICCQLVGIPLYIGFQFVPNGSLAVYAIVITFGISLGSHYFIPWLMLTDIIEGCYLQTKERLDTTFVALTLSINSLGITLGLMMATIGLEIAGYKLGSCVQPDTVGSAMRILLSAFTSVLTVVGVVFLWQYPITGERQKEIMEAIKKRKLANAFQHDASKRNGSLSDMNEKALIPVEILSSTAKGLEEEDNILSSKTDLSVLFDCRESVI